MESIKLRNATLAFMDDTTWIANSKRNMQSILNIAREFYKANDSQINSSKSVLIVINNKEEKTTNHKVQAGINKEIVTSLHKKEFTRFLGIWIGNLNPKKDAIMRIQNETRAIINALSHKKATKKKLFILSTEFSYLE